MKKIVIGSFLVSAIFVSGIALAASDGLFINPDNTLRAAVKDNGSVRLLQPGQEPNSKESEVTWNIQGPKGDKGDTGAPGEQGPKGDRGPAGPSGISQTRVVEETIELDAGHSKPVTAFCGPG